MVNLLLLLTQSSSRSLARVKQAGLLARILCLFTVTLASSSPVYANNWSIRVANWNVLNFGDAKAGIDPVEDRAQLLNRMASISSDYQIIFLQEILDDGASVTTSLKSQAALNNFNCSELSLLMGRAGRQERYSICYQNMPGLTLLRFDQYMNNQYQAIDQTQQTAQNIWMRPALRARFQYIHPQPNPTQTHR